ncbi:MAG TPA: AraC family transcriptional regulator [Planctomycetota bacterium]|nr:AraC family transcriptional regulator [Planctomycetota bacterium]
MEASAYDPDIRILLCRMHRLASWTLANISAPHWRLYWNDRPGASVFLDDRRFDLSPAHFMVIPPNTPCRTELSLPVTHFYLHFLAAAPFDAVAPTVIVFPAAPELLAAVREARPLIEGPAAAGDGGSGPRLAVLAHMLAALALSRVPPGQIPEFRADERVVAARRTMEARLGSPPDNSELAAAAGMNVNAFIRLFRRVTGRSPQAWLVARRIDRACLLLQGGAMGIKEIAVQCGFCDRYHFSRVFKRLRGVGPAEFRRRSYWREAGGGAQRRESSS